MSKIIWSDCRSCGSATRHEVLNQHQLETGVDVYHECNTWQIVSCLGCETVALRHRYDDFENVSVDDEGNTYHETETNVYPKFIKNHRKLTHAYYLPHLIRKVYLQTLAAYSENAYVLASIGLRATIEAVCGHLKLSGSTLEKRIDQLFRAGYVSNGDKKRLHAIRFLGNDAAHEIKEPKESELRVALEIVEHMLNSVFILERKAKSLETVIESYVEFLPMLEDCVKKTENNKIVSLTTILGRRRRLVDKDIDSFEDQLKQDIVSEKINYLAIDRVEKISGKDIQLYSVILKDVETQEFEFDDDIPF